MEAFDIWVVPEAQMYRNIGLPMCRIERAWPRHPSTSACFLRSYSTYGISTINIWAWFRFEFFAGRIVLNSILVRYPVTTAEVGKQRQYRLLFSEVQIGLSPAVPHSRQDNAHTLGPCCCAFRADAAAFPLYCRCICSRQQYRHYM